MTKPTDPAEAAVDSSTPLLAYELVTHHPTRRGNVRIAVDRSGAVRVQRNDAEPAAGEQWTSPFGAEPRSMLGDAEARLFRVLESGGFFTMAPDQVNEAANDGTRQTLTWSGKAGPRTVTVDRARSPGFDALRGELLRLLGLVGVA